jgi:hypothetical protein
MCEYANEQSSAHPRIYNLHISKTFFDILEEVNKKRRQQYRGLLLALKDLQEQREIGSNTSGLMKE